MFQRVADWPRAVAMICDIAKGTVSISLRTYSRREEKRGGGPEVSGWDYRQVQAHGQSGGKSSQLVDNERLSQTLLGIASSSVEFFAYEVDGGSRYEDEAKHLIEELADATVTVVAFTVGSVAICWVLVSLNQNRDVIHWKMRYHERDQRPELRLP